jgi:hypothetical protein
MAGEKLAKPNSLHVAKAAGEGAASKSFNRD